MAILLQGALPELANEMRKLLAEGGRPGLAAQVESLEIVDRRRCGESFCASFYPAPPRHSWKPGNESIVLNSPKREIVLDVRRGKIAYVEVQYCDDLRKELLAICPWVGEPPD